MGLSALRSEEGVVVGPFFATGRPVVAAIAVNAAAAMRAADAGRMVNPSICTGRDGTMR